MQFILTGFTQQLGFRVFGFEGKRDKGDDKAKTSYTVKADLNLIRLHGIRVQELPLLCRAMLERIMLEPSSEAQLAWTFTEAEMSLHEKDSVAARVAATAKKRLTRRPPVTPNTGAGWRLQQPVLET